MTLILLSLISMACAQMPNVTMSFPPDCSLCRATIPFFGTAAVVNGKDSEFKEWRLEYGEGRKPASWNRLAGGTSPVKQDPWIRHEVVWNPNTGAHGNLYNWNTGLVGYAYGEWRNNLNGIYTIRLVAELKNGKVAERRITLFIGEAMIRINGGTALSVDGLCRFSVPPFSNERDQDTVVVVVRYEPTGQAAFPTSETGEEAQRPYGTVPTGFTLLSAIYRIYPVGMETDPPSQIQIDVPSLAAGAGQSSSARIYSYNPSQKKWLPHRTQWVGKTAIARITRVPPPEAFYAVMRCTLPPDPPSVTWRPLSILSGSWIGRAEPGSKVRINDGQTVSEVEATEEGDFEQPYVLNPAISAYEFTVARASGELSGPCRVPVSPEVIMPGQTATLRALGKAEFSAKEPIQWECEDPRAIQKPDKPGCMSLIIQRDNLERLAIVELKPLARNSPIFTATLRAGTGAGEVPVAKLHQGEGIRGVLMNGMGVRVIYKDICPPLIRNMESPTHRAVMWSNPSDALTPQLKPLNALSGVQITRSGGALRLAGSRAPSTRLVKWPVDGFSTATTPTLSFDYKCTEPGPWQLMARCGSSTLAFPLGNTKPYFPTPFPSPPLIDDGNWHSYEINLFHAKDKRLEQVDEILMGSWFAPPEIFMTVEPGFKNTHGNVLYLKNLWVGKPSTELSAVMQWVAEDPSGISKCHWWVDDRSDSTTAPEGGLKGEVENYTRAPTQQANVRFTLPAPGRWYFHARALDQAGNWSEPATYPLRVISQTPEAGSRSSLGTDDMEPEIIPWQQPDGKCDFKLKGIGGAFDPLRTELLVGGETYAVPKNTWDIMNETMTIDKESFTDRAPLGMDGKIMNVEVALYDAQGRRLAERPQFKVQTSSPFSWEETEDGMKLGIKKTNPPSEWYAHWAIPEPPWGKLFPGTVHNVLLLSKPLSPEAVKKKEQPIMWAWPVELKGNKARAVVWRETWQSPQREMFDGESAMALLDPTKPGYKSVYWTWKQDGTEPFTASNVRVVTLLQDNQFSMQSVPLRQLGQLLNRQPPGSRMRVDGWLHPLHARSFHLKLGGNRRMTYGFDDSFQWMESKGRDVLLNAREDWTRFAVIIEATRRFTERNDTVVEGSSYW